MDVPDSSLRRGGVAYLSQRLDPWSLSGLAWLGHQGPTLPTLPSLGKAPRCRRKRIALAARRRSAVTHGGALRPLPSPGPLPCRSLAFGEGWSPFSPFLVSRKDRLSLPCLGNLPWTSLPRTGTRRLPKQFRVGGHLPVSSISFPGLRSPYASDRGRRHSPKLGPSLCKPGRFVGARWVPVRRELRTFPAVPKER